MGLKKECELTDRTSKIRVFVLMAVLVAVALFLPDYLKKRDTVKNEQTIAQVYKQGLPVILEFTSKTCGTCAQMKPIVAQLKKEYSGRVFFREVDVDSKEANAFLNEFNVEYLPSFYLTVSRKNVFEHFEGAQDIQWLRGLIDRMLADGTEKSNAAPGNRKSNKS